MHRPMPAYFSAAWHFDCDLLTSGRLGSLDFDLFLFLFVLFLLFLLLPLLLLPNYVLRRREIYS